MPAFATLRRWFAPANPYNGELVKLKEQLEKRTKQLQEATLLWGDSFGWPDSPMGSRFGPGRTWIRKDGKQSCEYARQSRGDNENGSDGKPVAQ